MRSRYVFALALLWILGAATLAQAQFGPKIDIRYTCAPGRFRISYSKGKTWHYCYDGKYYNDKTLPADIRAYFENVDREHKESMAKFKQEWDQKKNESDAYWASVDNDRRAKGLPTLAEQRAVFTKRTAERRAQLASGRASGSTSGYSRPSGTKAGAGVEASAKPEAEPIMPAALEAVPPGAKPADVLDALGDPPGKVFTGEGAETWTYVLTTGEFAKVKFVAGSVKEVVLPK